jgi:beta-amylase
MMPLQTISNSGNLNNPSRLEDKLSQLKKIGTDGIMVDVWWGIVEKNGAHSYNWDGYRDLVAMCKRIGLKMQVVMAFHQCGGNVGDECNIEIPRWVGRNKDHFYTDRNGNADFEYLSLGVDLEPVFGGRTAAEIYSDFMLSFAKTFRSDIGKDATIVTIEVGLGPAGELRYPSYQLAGGKWSFPGVGEFQCYDKYMLARLQKAANAVGQPEWGKAGPVDEGDYKQRPNNVPFFSSGSENYDSAYGRFFLKWYATELINHGSLIIGAAAKIFNSMGVKVAAKVAGVHWWYNSEAHGPELTAGYYNTNGNDGYRDIAQMLRKHGAEFQFTALEMLNRDQGGCGCNPESLVSQTRNAAWDAGLSYSGENALPMYDSERGYEQILRQSKSRGKTISAFTFLRMADEMFNNHAFQLFANFVDNMHKL